MALLFVSMLGGCASLMSNAASGLAENLTRAMLNQDDPETVRAGAPSYMLLLDSFLEGSPDNPDMLAAAATLYASYGAVFAGEEDRAARLTARARSYALQAMCESYRDACDWRGMPYDAFVASLNGVNSRHADYLFTYGFATLAYLRAHSSDWNALAELPQAEALLNHYLKISGDSADTAAYTYLGMLLTIRPPALGGQQEQAQVYFEKAIAATGGRDLSIKVEYAKGVAKVLYDRDLHDRLIAEVLEASPYADGYTLSNVIAQQEASKMAADADNYF
ncbi:MAG: TRAP transporter TatT component family protein [Gammaproteobacteria bacterium]|nr:TRAP transporter TatT component family protein [Gammaproteobacteria bacterium]